MKTEEIDHLNTAMLQHRKENFAVETEVERHPIEDGQIVLSVTNNGSQWSSISLLKSEIKKVVTELSKHL